MPAGAKVPDSTAIVLYHFNDVWPGDLGGLLFTFIKYQSLIPLYLKLTEKILACFSLMAGRKERESIDFSEVDNKYYSGFYS